MSLWWAKTTGEGVTTHNILLKGLDEPKIFNGVECITIEGRVSAKK